MGLLVAVVVIAVVVWFFARSTSPRTDVAQSALQALREADALVVAAWQKLEALVETTPDPPLTAALVAGMRRSDLPAEINQMWTYLDDLSARSNQRAEHYEMVARTPAPPMAGRVESDRVMARIRSLAATRPLIEAPKPKAPKALQAAKLGSNAGDADEHPRREVASSAPPAEAPDQTKCPACGVGVLRDAKFCDACGAGLHTACAKCGAPNRPRARFCKACGTEMPTTE